MMGGNIYTDLFALEGHLRARVRDYLDGHGLDEAAYRLLRYIGENSGCRTADLMRAERCDRAALNRRLSVLGARGFIRKKPCKADSRAYTLHLTPAGRAVVSAVGEICERWDSELRAALGEGDYLSLQRAVRRLEEASSGRGAARQAGANPPA